MSSGAPARHRYMLIIAGHLTVDPAHRDAFIAAHHDLLRRARQAPGCLDVAITADPLDPARINNYERWESREDLDRWRAVANAPNTGITMHNVAVSLYTVTDERPPF
ncbi:putative quinol monooxygenase [Kibdelosporangium persicum]|uniref:Antibiotic biosynthesis monooxygenase n=1 Tax=Kibdelosporangium persicum TaxID=2698649 RepID=A0ABX2F277_9PSEU|nr:antibiotic biosynthesis monooxygenase family protein [Kibdelosporangium persicum]NRN65410.1 Antibiotic biosynthesis monooxygenase [Kibdelosporangium persicum]